MNDKPKTQKVKWFCGDKKYHFLRVPIHYSTKADGTELATITIDDVIVAEKNAGYYDFEKEKEINMEEFKEIDVDAELEKFRAEVTNNIKSDRMKKGPKTELGRERCREASRNYWKDRNAAEKKVLEVGHKIMELKDRIEKEISWNQQTIQYFTQHELFDMGDNIFITLRARGQALNDVLAMIKESLVPERPVLIIDPFKGKLIAEANTKKMKPIRISYMDTKIK